MPETKTDKNKERIDNSTAIFGDINSPLSIMDGTRQKINITAQGIEKENQI